MLRLAPVLAFCLLFAAGGAYGQVGVRPHPTIYVCTDDSDTMAQLQQQLPSTFTIVDGRTVTPPEDISEVTLAYFGHLGGTADECIQRYPDGRKILNQVVSGAERDAAGVEQRLKKLGAKVVGRSVPTQATDWDRDSAPMANWLVDVCLPANQACTNIDGIRTLFRMARSR